MYSGQEKIGPVDYIITKVDKDGFFRWGVFKSHRWDCHRIFQVSDALPTQT